MDERLQVDNNLFAVNTTETLTNFASEYDPLSIMHYPILQEWTNGTTLTVGMNTELSARDKEFIKSMLSNGLWTHRINLKLTDLQ